jgi:hypothetical protein
MDHLTSGIGPQLSTALYRFMEKCRHVAVEDGDVECLAKLDIQRAPLTECIVIHFEKVLEEQRLLVQKAVDYTAAEVMRRLQSLMQNHHPDG